jgi:hypothetical protein
LFESYSQNIDYDFNVDVIPNDANDAENDAANVSNDAENYVAHPINAFHLMKRTANWMNKIKNQLLMKQENPTEKNQVLKFFFILSV